jgi:hypothetical protein
MYVELKSGHSDNGPAWIGLAHFSKTGQMVYFNGSAFKKGHGISGNYFEISTGNEYWISGVKKEGTNRHWAGGGIIMIDKDCVAEYLLLVGYKSLSPKDYQVVTLINKPIKEEVTEYENQPVGEEFDTAIMQKNMNELSDKELLSLEANYSERQIAYLPKKTQKTALQHWDDCRLEIQKRGLVND